MTQAPLEPITDDLDTTDADESPDGDVGAEPLQVTIDAFDLAKHDATVTMVSPRTGDHRTLRIRTVRRGKLAGKRLLELLTGPNNQSDFLPFAFVSSETDRLGVPYVNVWKAYRGTSVRGGYTGQSVHEALAGMIRHPDVWAARGVTYAIALRCRRCGRLLTVPESIATGLGPICAGRE